MKRVALALCMLFVNSSWALADDPAMAGSHTGHLQLLATVAATTHTILGGVVKSVSWADSAKGTKSEIVVKDARGKTTNILVTSTTTLWDADAKAIMPDKIVSRGRVNVIYLTTPEGINEGESIKILK